MEKYVSKDNLITFKEGVDEELDAKQDTLVSGTNIKNINNESLLGSGNISIIPGMPNPMTTAEDIIVGGVSGAPSRLAKGANHSLLGVNGSGNLAYLTGLPYLTTAPVADNTDGDVKIVVLTAEPAARYANYLYFIAPQNQQQPTLINFTVSLTQYQAESGMTWAQWVSSVYNTNGFTNEGPYISSGYLQVTYGGNIVDPSDAIIDEGAYVLSGGGSN